MINKIYIAWNDLDTIPEIKSSFKEFLQFFISNVKEFFDVLTGDSNSVYIAFILDSVEDDNFKVFTYYRDPISYRSRSYIDNKKKEYLTSNFTPFKTIVDPTNTNDIYICDDCKNENGYIDRIDDWNRYYNACLTVPIRMPLSNVSENNKFVYFGFITVDNKKGGYKNLQAVEALNSFADNLFNAFSFYNDLITYYNECNLKN